MGSDDDDERLRPITPPLDPNVAVLASRLHTSKQSGDGDDGVEPSSDFDDDELFEGLEKNDYDMGRIREQRLEALKAQMTKAKDMRESDHGRLTEIVNEKEVIQASAKENRCIIHFFHRDFRRCQVMDKHLEILAPRHFSTRFIRVFVENVPWLVEKLQIKVLPCVICFINGVSRDRLIGFEEIGNDDTFTTSALELRLSQSGVISAPQSRSLSLKTPYASSKIRDSGNDEEDDDWSN